MKKIILVIILIIMLALTGILYLYDKNSIPEPAVATSTPLE